LSRAYKNSTRTAETKHGPGPTDFGFEDQTQRDRENGKRTAGLYRVRQAGNTIKQKQMSAHGRILQNPATGDNGPKIRQWQTRGKQSGKRRETAPGIASWPVGQPLAPQ